MTLEEAYRENVRAIHVEHPKGSAAREAARRQLSERLEVDQFKRDGRNRAAIHRPQQQFAAKYLQLVTSFYGGEIDDTTYRRRRIRALRRYAERLFESGLVTAVFDDDWIRDFARDSLLFERQLLPVKTTGLTDDDAWLLCNPLREFSRTFFRAVHQEFGIAQLQEHAQTYGGVRPRRRDGIEAQ